MRPISRCLTLCTILLTAQPSGVRAQTASNLAAMRGLAPVAALPDSVPGKAALAANLRITGGIQTGQIEQPLLRSFPDQQRQALRDAFITGWNLSELTDGLGTVLGPAYRKHAEYRSATQYSNVSPAIANLIAYTIETAERDSDAAKFFFANATMDKAGSAAPLAAKILAAEQGVTDVFGKAYGHAAGSVGADPYGDSRPFQTEPTLRRFSGRDYFGDATTNASWLRGPAQDLVASPSYPSGHTTYGYAGSVLLAVLVPSRYAQQMTRAAEYGNDRIILGAHYAMDVIAGRTLALYDLAHLLSDDPAYVGQTRSHATPVQDYRRAVANARRDLLRVLREQCGRPVADCAAADRGRFRREAANEAMVEATMTYGLPTVHANTASGTEDVSKLAPEAGNLLTAAFPSLTLAQADDILTATEGPGGGFLDDGSGFGLYSRMNLAAAGARAAARQRPSLGSDE